MNKIQSYFEQRTSWEDAVKDTPSGLAPVAVMLQTVGSLPEIDAELSEAYHPQALVCMTTRYTNPKYDGQLGWMHLNTEVKKVLSDLLFDNGFIDTWVYFAQFHAGEEDE